MGTTTTPNLGLIKPDGSEPGKNFPAQQNANIDVIDALFPGKNTYTPIFTGTGNNALADEGSGGDAERTGLYIVIDKLVIVWFRITFGSSGVTIPTGDIEVSLPIQPDTTSMKITETVTRKAFFTGLAHFDGNGITDDNYAGLIKLVPAASTAIAPDVAVRILRDNFATSSFSWDSDFLGNENEYVSGVVAYLKP